MENNKPTTVEYIGKFGSTFGLPALLYEIANYFVTNNDLKHFLPYVLPLISFGIDKVASNIISQRIEKRINSEIESIKKNYQDAFNDPNIDKTTVDNLKAEYTKLTAKVLSHQTSKVYALISEDNSSNASET
ncbi:hypothetical protein E4O05_01580 [Treponema sp. OMZ 787]|uniref:hypothetical protein n=1 Tax=Treponema sp. OMZ 787 TaxID=2563669 RepID=UPI0020A3405E|nr:hypothetical protein [Treponema sp. OMZ 787]UTC62628.1 hypothetical protein E4O05_01580 [Treponema sp. OMZ 787]